MNKLQNELMYDLTVKCVETIDLIDQITDLPVPSKLKSRANALLQQIEGHIDSQFSNNRQMTKIYDQDLLLINRVKKLPITQKLAVDAFIDRIEKIELTK